MRMLGICDVFDVFDVFDSFAMGEAFSVMTDLDEGLVGRLPVHLGCRDDRNNHTINRKSLAENDTAKRSSVNEMTQAMRR